MPFRYWEAVADRIRQIIFFDYALATYLLQLTEQTRRFDRSFSHFRSTDTLLPLPRPTQSHFQFD